MIRGFKLTLIALFCFLAAGQFIGTGAQSQDMPAERFFKNIQALKGVPMSRIGGLMDSYNKALGVTCEYCHVSGDLSKGDKPAHKVSVQEIIMTREINEKYKHTVDCMSCHQGKAKPGGKPDVVIVKDDVNPNKDEKTFPASAGNVFFPHGTHKSMDCSKCHHQGGNIACANCHKHNAGDAALSFKMVSHSVTSNRACTGCHKQMKIGPQACDTCHKQEKNPDGTPPKPPGPITITFPTSYGKVTLTHGAHMTAFQDCSKCHHTGGTGACGTCHKHNGGDARMSFKKVGHSLTSNRACMGCHTQMKVGPQTCAACHK
jgi:hypothetical protein